MSAKIKEGVFLLSKKSTDNYITIRRVGAENDYGFDYVQIAPDFKVAQRRCCSDSALRAWGTPISESEARRLVPNMDEQIEVLRRNECEQGKELSRSLAPAILTLATDDALIGELERRGYTVKADNNGSEILGND